MQLPEDWQRVLSQDVTSDYFAALQRFVADERSLYSVYPSEKDLFNAFRYTPFSNVRIVIVGQDPYHNEGQAHGLSFSVPEQQPRPPSLVNILRELAADLGCQAPTGGCLTPWAKQGVLLLNAVLSVRAHTPNSHRNRGWEQFTDNVIRVISERESPCVFILWGANAQRKAALLDIAKHTVIMSAHPSPLSARNGFFGSRPFSRANAALVSQGLEPIDWCDL